MSSGVSTPPPDREAELRASEARYRALVTAAGSIIFRATPSGEIIEAPGWEALTGQSEDDYRGYGWFDVVHPEDRGPAVVDWSQAVAADQPMHLDYRVRTRSGEWRWMHGYAVRVPDEAGGLAEWVGTATDVHDLYEARAALKERDSFHQFAAEAGRAGSWYVRLESQECVLSAVAASLVGLGTEEVTLPLDTWLGRIEPEDREAIQAAGAALIERDEPIGLEFRARGSGDETLCLFIRGGLARDAAGQALRIHGSIVDLTERKRHEVRRTAMNDLADRLGDLNDPALIFAASARTLGRALTIDRVGFGEKNAVTGALRTVWDWAAPGLVPADPTAAAEDTAPGLAPSGAAAFTVIPVGLHGGAASYVALAHNAFREWTEDEIAFARDVAQRTRTAVKRRLAERDLRALAATLEHQVEARTAERDRLWRNSRDLLAVVDRQGVFLSANPAWTTILGWPTDAVVGRNCIDFIHPDDQAPALAGLQMALKRELPAHDTRYRHRDGGWRWISWMAAPAEGLVYATGRHVTAEHEAAESLEKAEARLRTIFETSYQYQGLLDLQGLVLDVNATALSVIDATLAQVVGRPFWDAPWFASTPDVVETVRAAVARAASGEAVRQELQLLLPTVGWRILDMTLRPSRDSRNSMFALVLEAMDITERRQAEQALRQHHKLEAMGQLTGGVAHDFNNLLTPIIGGLDLLARRGVGEERERRLIDGALQSAERARVLVQRLLAFARRQPLRTEPVDLGLLIAGMADLIASTTGPQIRVVTEVESALPPALADANQLEMAILNLSVNARDAMPDGGVLRISAEAATIAPGHASKLHPGRYIHLSVADNGSGMDEATVAHAIEPFFSTKGLGRGTGLGLSMVHGLASQLGGALTIASKLQLGTNIELWLPISREAAAQPESPAATPALAIRGVALLVDDEALVRASIADMLAELGYEVAESSCGEDALERLDADPSIDLLVTDHLMPGMSGAELARAAVRRRPELKVIVVSGYAEAEALAPDLPRLVKPFRHDELAASLAALTINEAAALAKTAT